MLAQGKGTNEGTESVPEKRMVNGITKMLPQMANEKTKMVLELELEGNPLSGETTIMLKKELADGETTKLHSMNSNARCSCCQVADSSASTLKFTVTFKKCTKRLFEKHF